MSQPSPIQPEIEAKLLVADAYTTRALARLEQLGPYHLRARDTVRLRSTYVDTQEFTLARNGVALRVRRCGTEWEATAKWAGSVEGMVHERPELTVPLPRAPRFPFVLPDGALRLQLTALVAGRALVPIVITVIQRRRFDVLVSDDLPPVAELALDRVHLRAPEGAKAVVAYTEVEIELRHGTRDDVVQLARTLQQQFALIPSAESKFSRGVMLLHGSQLTAPLPVVSVTDTLGQAVRKIVALHLQRLRACDPGTRLGEDPEALHDMRVATRRLRAAERAFAAGIPRALQAYLPGELGWLGQILGGVRDLDVQLTLLKTYCSTAPADQQEGLTVLRTYLETERARRRVEMLAGLDSPRYLRLLIRLERFTLSASPRRGGFADPVVTVGRAAIKRAYRGVQKRGELVGTLPTDEELHALRIRAKRLRYLLEFLRPITGKPGKRLIKRMVQLQDVLGAHHDAVVAVAFIRGFAEGAGAQSGATTLLTLGAFAGSQLQRAEGARAAFRKTWRRFSRRRTRADLRAVLDQLGTAAPAAPEHDRARTERQITKPQIASSKQNSNG
jgi:inorganic triphosphatase YgiF